MKRIVKVKNNIEYYMGLSYSMLLHQIEDEGQKYWIAEIPELPGCTSHGKTIEEAVASVEEAKKDWILDSLEDGEEIPTPIERDKFSGRTLLRMSRSLHRALSLIAETEKLSLNQFIVTVLAKEVGRLGVLNRVEEKLDNLFAKLEKDRENTTQSIVLTPDMNSFIGDIRQQYLWQAQASTSLRKRFPIIERVTRGALASPSIVGTASDFESFWNYHPQDIEKENAYNYVNSIMPVDIGDDKTISFKDK